MNAKALTAAGYTKTKVSELVAGDVVRGVVFGDLYNVCDRVVEFVRQYRASGKAVHYVGGGVYNYGNASKVWTKGATCAAS